MMARSDKIFSIAFTATSMLLASMVAAPALAGQLDCDDMAASLNDGDRYEFKIELQTKSMRLEKGDDFYNRDLLASFIKKYYETQNDLAPVASFYYFGGKRFTRENNSEDWILN